MVMSKMKSNIIGLKDLRENTQKYISQVEKGKSFTIVRRSRPIFKIVPVDEWGDEGEWNTVVDFTKIRPGGVPAEEIVASLRRLIKDESGRQISKKAKSKRKNTSSRTS